MGKALSKFSGPSIVVAVAFFASSTTWADLPVAADAENSASTDICFNFEAPGGGGDLTGWTLFNLGDVDRNWGTNDDGICRGGNPPAPGNFTGGIGGAACVESETLGPGLIDAYFCSPHIDFSAASEAVIEFRYNFQINAPPVDRFEVLLGTAVPSPSSIVFYDSLFVRMDDAGTYNGWGVLEQIVLEDTFGAGYFCFHYLADGDHYAMIDNVSIGPGACGLSETDLDIDGTADDSDNCVGLENADQRDSNKDGFGNLCDADFDNNCAVSFGDLAILKRDFLASGDLDTDINGDGTVGFHELAALKSSFLQPPGPSALAECATQWVISNRRMNIPLRGERNARTDQ